MTHVNKSPPPNSHPIPPTEPSFGKTDTKQEITKWVEWGVLENELRGEIGPASQRLLPEGGDTRGDQRGTRDWRKGGRVGRWAVYSRG